MVCPKCKQVIRDDSAFCPYCGFIFAHNKNERICTNPCAILGFIFSFFSPIIGFGLSVAGLCKASAYGSGRGLSICGILCSIAFFLVFVILIVVVLNFYNIQAILDSYRVYGFTPC